jgi:hypothetical protein
MCDDIQTVPSVNPGTTPADLAAAYDRRGIVRGTRAVALSLLLTLCAIAWLRVLQTTGLAVTDVWAYSLAHIAKDALLIFPVALLAIAAGTGLADRWDFQPSFAGFVASAALIAAAFGFLLVPVLGLHHYAAHVLDGNEPGHSFHGLARAGNPGALGRLSWNLLEGLHDALLTCVVAVPSVLLGLKLLAATARRHGAPQADRPRARGTLRRAVVTSSVALCVYAAAIGSVSFALTKDGSVHHAEHGSLAASVPVGVEAKVGSVRVAVQSATWLRQPRETRQFAATSVRAVPDRVYLDVRIKNVGTTTRRIGRRDFRLRGPDGSWGPLADDFPDFVLAPQEQLHTRLIFEVPHRPVELEFAWDDGTPRVHVPLADDVPAGFFQALCRGVLNGPSWD